MVLIQGISITTGKYTLENNISNGFKLFTTIKERIMVRVSSRQVDRQISEHPSRAKQG